MHITRVDNYSYVILIKTGSYYVKIQINNDQPSFLDDNFMSNLPPLPLIGSDPGSLTRSSCGLMPNMEKMKLHSGQLREMGQTAVPY